MKKKEEKRVKKPFLWGFLGSLLFAFVFVACGDNSTASNTSAPPNNPEMSGINMGTATATAMMATGSDPMTNSLRSLSGKDFEIRFMQEMIVHHQSAIDMAKLVPTQTKRLEINTLAQNITTAQSKEIGEMTSWLKTWYHEKPLTDPMSVPGMTEMMGGMGTLKNMKDAAFDKQFTIMMIQHHQQAVNMAHLIPGKTQRPELVELGQNIIKTQSSEIQQMQTWQQEWFKA